MNAYVILDYQPQRLKPRSAPQWLRIVALLLFVFGLDSGLSSAVFAADKAKPFITSADLDLSQYLPPPSANDSLQTKNELAELLKLQLLRTPEMEARAKADADENIWRFADVMGPKFKQESLPNFSAFFERVIRTEGAVVDPSKEKWNRLRPYQLSELVKPAVPLSKSGSYPSGHGTVGTMMGIVLANMVPERRAEIMARAWDFGENRIIGGVHYRSDVEAARISGMLIAAEMMKRSEFKAAYEPAKKELRNALGLPAESSRN